MPGNAPPTKKSKPPAARPKPKPNSKPVLPKKLYRSEERIVESSDEGEEVGSTSVYGTTTGKSESESESENGSEDGSSTKKGSESDEEEEKSSLMTNDSDITKYKYTYIPPPTFKPIPPPSSSTNPFSAHNLEGKELWFITAPLVAPLSKLTDVNPADIAEGMPILETGSRRYSLRALGDTEELTGVALAVQDGKSGSYKIASKKITKSFKLVEDPPEPTVPLDKIPKSKLVREQPEGLWMRFKPIGYVGAQDEDANVEMMDVEVRPPREHADGGHGKKRKSHKEGVNGGSTKKEKKHRNKEKHRIKSTTNAS